MKPKKPRQPNNHQKLISRFVTVEFSATAKTFWPNEMRIAGQLIKKYEMEFLLWMQPPNNYKVTSLVWFLTPEGKHYLSDQLFEYRKQTTNLTPQERVLEAATEKVGEDMVVVQRPRTLKDFINYGQTQRRQETGATSGLQQTKQNDSLHPAG